MLCDTLHKTDHLILKTFNSQARIKLTNCLINRTPISPYINQHYYAHFTSFWLNFMSMDPWVSYRAGTWLIDECQIAFFMSCLILRNLKPLFLLSFSMSFVLRLQCLLKEKIKVVLRCSRRLHIYCVQGGCIICSRWLYRLKRWLQCFNQFYGGLSWEWYWTNVRLVGDYPWDGG